MKKVNKLNKTLQQEGKKCHSTNVTPVMNQPTCLMPCLLNLMKSKYEKPEVIAQVASFAQAVIVKSFTFDA